MNQGSPLLFPGFVLRKHKTAEHLPTGELLKSTYWLLEPGSKYAYLVTIYAIENNVDFEIKSAADIGTYEVNFAMKCSEPGEWGTGCPKIYTEVLDGVTYWSVGNNLEYYPTHFNPHNKVDSTGEVPDTRPYINLTNTYHFDPRPTYFTELQSIFHEAQNILKDISKYNGGNLECVGNFLDDIINMSVI